MSSKTKNKKRDLLDAFWEGNADKIFYLTRHLPDEAKGSIFMIIQDSRGQPDIVTPLVSSIMHGNYHMCKMLIEEGAPIHKEFMCQPSPLSLALEQKHSDIAELLIRSGADVNIPDTPDMIEGNIYPLYLAIFNNLWPSVVEQILRAGFPVNKPVKKKENLKAIQCAAIVNNMDAAEVLVRHKADLNAVNFQGDTAVSIAIKHNFCGMVQFLVDKGAELVNKRASMCPLLLAIRMEHLKMVELLLDMGVSIKSGWVSTEVVPHLQFAASYLNVDIIKLLVNKGADVNAVNVSTKETALHVVPTYLGRKYSGDTLKSMQTKICKLLIDRGANVNVKDYDGRTPLDGAIYSENTELCKLFLREGADITHVGRINDDRFSNRFEYIAYVSSFKCPELIDLCLERGCDYNFRDRHGLTPYHCAMAKHNPEMVKVFWKHGCPFDQPEKIPGKMQSMLWYTPDSTDKSILKIQSQFIEGIKGNNFTAVKNALKNGAVPRGCSVKMPSPLHYLAANGAHLIAKLLLENGVPVNRVNKDGHTPLFVAVKKKQLQTCKVFLQFGASFELNKSVKSKTIKTLAKEDEQLHSLFKIINHMFKLAKDGSNSLLSYLNRCVQSKNRELLRVLMNCVNRQGLTLTGTAVASNHLQLAKELMILRVKHI